MAILQANIDWMLGFFRARLGDDYDYGRVWTEDPSQGCDCSGAVGTVLECLVNGPDRMNWGHVVSTESWFYDYNANRPANPGSIGPYGTIAIASPADLSPDAALLICIMHGGGGEDSHMNAILQGTIIESNGNHGTCTNGTGANPADADLWTDWWFLPGPVISGGADYLSPQVVGALAAQFL